VNTTVGGEPIAATYCPLCDSATVFSRRVTPATPKDASGDGSGTKPSTAPAPIVLEFGVSGALYNSNVLMYDKKDKGLWSQLGMHALSGPLTGTALEMLPVEVVSFAAFKKARPAAKIVSKDTGHNRDYSKSPYESYFKNENLMVPAAGVRGIKWEIPGQICRPRFHSTASSLTSRFVPIARCSSDPFTGMCDLCEHPSIPKKLNAFKPCAVQV